MTEQNGCGSAGSGLAAFFVWCAEEFKQTPRFALGGYVFRRTTGFALFVVGHGLEARATRGRMAVPQGYFARIDTYFGGLGGLREIEVRDCCTFFGRLYYCRVCVDLPTSF